MFFDNFRPTQERKREREKNPLCSIYQLSCQKWANQPNNQTTLVFSSLFFLYVFSLSLSLSVCFTWVCCKMFILRNKINICCFLSLFKRLRRNSRSCSRSSRSKSSKGNTRLDLCLPIFLSNFTNQREFASFWLAHLTKQAQSMSADWITNTHTHKRGNFFSLGSLAPSGGNTQPHYTRSTWFRAERERERILKLASALVQVNLCTRLLPTMRQMCVCLQHSLKHRPQLLYLFIYLYLNVCVSVCLSICLSVCARADLQVSLRVLAGAASEQRAPADKCKRAAH